MVKAPAAKTQADQRLERLLVMVPWVSAQEGPDVEHVTERFGITEEELAKDLELLFLCGLYPFTPDALMEADIVDGRVWIRFTEAFVRPPTFTRHEAVSVVAAAAAVAELPGNDDNTALRSALQKLVAALGLGDDDVLDIAFTDAPADLLGLMQQATRESRSVEVDYYSYGRDTWSRRTIQPWQVFNREGQWYVQAFAPEAGEKRTFRIDRMRNASLTDETFQRPAELPQPSVFDASPDDPIVELRLRPAAAWVVEHYPTEQVKHLDDGQIQVALRVSEPAWIQRLLLRLGPTASVVSGEVEVDALVRRLRDRYAIAAPAAPTQDEQSDVPQ